MSAKSILVFCIIQAYFIQIALSQQCTSHASIEASRFSSPYGIVGLPQASLAYDRIAAPDTYALIHNGYPGIGLANNGYCSPATEFVISSGGGLPVTSMSSIAPTGITVRSDNAYEGPVIVTGELPFIGAVAMEGILPTAGIGGIQYSCGNGVVAMLSEGPAYPPGPNMAFDAGSGFRAGAALGLGNGIVPAAGCAHAAGFPNANRLGYGGSCSSCGRRILY